jgi:dihydroxyacetone kinase-like predicted kinase
VKIHVHNERPDQVIAYGLSLGSLSRITVENLDKQAQDRRKRAESGVSPGPSAAPTNGASGPAVVSSFVPVTASSSPMPDGLAVVAVAQGNGLARLFGELGVAVVDGGQGHNPSAGELAAAIRATGRDEVIVLPNNANVRLAAKQAGELLPDVKVKVVPTRNAAEGVAALLALDPSATPDANMTRMTKSAHAVQTLQVTRAVRDARMGRKKVRRGQHIVLDPDEGLLAADSDQAAALAAALGKLQPGFELLTMYYGDGVERNVAEQIADSLRSRFEDVEVELVEGGQPHYSLLVAAE